MEKFKIENYEKEMGITFPSFLELNTVEKSNLINLIKSEYNIKNSVFDDLVKQLKMLNYRETYDLKNILSEIDFKYQSSNLIEIIWSENNIDRMSIKDIIDHWEYIWYAESDEAIILFFPETNKIVMITHYGGIYFN